VERCTGRTSRFSSARVRFGAGARRGVRVGAPEVTGAAADSTSAFQSSALRCTVVPANRCLLLTTYSKSGSAACALNPGLMACVCAT
jgi:hypothetical protein